MKVILPKSLEEKVLRTLKSIPDLESYTWHFDFECHLDDDETPVVIKLMLQKKNN